MGNLSIKALFPRLFSLSSEKEITLRVVLDRRVDQSDGFLRFRRALLSWESDELISLEALLNSVGSGSSDRDDCLQWLANTYGQFSVSSLYSLLMPFTHLLVSKLLWNNIYPPKVQFLGWLAWKRRLKTFSFLQRIGVLGPEASVLCIFCRREEESVSHILLWCPFAWRVWSCLLQWWGCIGLYIGMWRNFLSGGVVLGGVNLQF